MKSTKFLYILLLILTGFPSSAQEETEGNQIEDAIAANDNIDEEAYELLAQRITEKTDLNAATAEDLRLVPFLSIQQINNFLHHRSENGKLVSLYELQTIDGFDNETIRRLLPYVTARPPGETLDKSIFRRIKKEGQHYVALLTTLPLETKTGYHDYIDDYRRFRGSEQRLLLRYRSFKPGDFSFGVTAEKDEGERFQWMPSAKRYGFDHLSIHAQLLNKGPVRNIIIGDYQCQFGQGLVWGGALGFGKGAETINTARKGNFGIVPYTSAYEAGFFRGTAATVTLPYHLSLTGILSFTYRDGNVRDNDGEASASSIITTGLHRNKGELSNYKKIAERVYGGVLEFRNRNIEGGITFQRINYNALLARKPQPYNQFFFNGRSNTNTGIFLNYNYYNLSFFSEIAVSVGHGMAGIMGALLSLSKKLELSLLYRKYDRDFHPFYNNGFSENTLTQNERGFYWGWKYKFSKRYVLSGYFDVFEFPWLKFRTYAPSDGAESLVRFSWHPSRSTQVYIQARHESKSRNTEGETNIYSLSSARKTNYWINLDYTVHSSLRMKTRVQGSRLIIDDKTTTGLLLSQDVVVTVGKWKATGRYSLFDTDDFDNRQYAYENDVWMNYALPAYYGKGTRKYILFQFKCTRSVTLWLKYSHTRYVNKQSIGSGLDEIPGNKRNDIKFETRIML